MGLKACAMAPVPSLLVLVLSLVIQVGPPELGIANDLEHWILLLLPLCCWVMTINTTPDRTEAVEQNEVRT